MSVYATQVSLATHKIESRRDLFTEGESFDRAEKLELVPTGKNCSYITVKYNSCIYTQKYLFRGFKCPLQARSLHLQEGLKRQVQLKDLDQFLNFIKCCLLVGIIIGDRF